MPPIAKPETVADFVPWAKTNISQYFDQRFKGFYESGISSALLAVQQHEFFQRIDTMIEQWNENERNAHHTDLLMEYETVALVRKPFDSVLSKCFRKNVLWNKRFPGQPKDGWVSPENIFDTTNDLIRGTLKCRYADGPEKLAKYLSIFAAECGLESNYYSQGRDDGYYAYHFYVTIPVELYGFDHLPINVSIQVEIQITTQLQDVLRQFTHEIYENNRENPISDNGAWKWELDSRRFRAGYLSHTLHLLEAIIVQLRNEGCVIEKENNE